MSKASALALAGGNPADATPGLVTPGLSPNGTKILQTGIEQNAVPDSTIPTEQSKKDNLDAGRLAIFAKKEAAIVREKEQLKLRWAEADKKEKEASEKIDRARKFEELRAKDPIEAMKFLGFTDTEIFNYMAGQEKKDPTPEEIARKTAQEETQKIRDEIAQEKKTLEETRNQRLIDNLKSDIGSKIKSDPEKYEYCAFEGVMAERQAYEFIVAVLKESNELISIDEALQMTESLYESRDKAMTGLKKRKPIIESTSEITVRNPEMSTMARRSQPGTAPTTNAAPRPKPTLTNEVAPSTSPRMPRRESQDEKKERIIQAVLNGTLGKK